MSYYVITLQDKTNIRVKSCLSIGDIVRYFLGDVSACHKRKGDSYKMETKYNGSVMCKVIRPTLSISPLEFHLTV